MEFVMFLSRSPTSCFIIITTDRSVFNDASSSHFHCTPTDFAWHLFSPDTAQCLLNSEQPSVSLQQWLSSSDCRYYIEINGNGSSDPTRALLTSCGDFELILSTAGSLFKPVPVTARFKARLQSVRTNVITGSNSVRRTTLYMYFLYWPTVGWWRRTFERLISHPRVVTVFLKDSS